jgi:hypothetical protein
LQGLYVAGPQQCASPNVEGIGHIG